MPRGQTVTTDVAFRPARVADAESVLSVKRAAIEDLAHWQYSPEQVAAWAPKKGSVDGFAEAIRDDRFAVRVAVHDGEVVGYSALNAREDRLDALYVRPAYQRQGIATTLLSHAEMEARFRGIEDLVVVAARNAVPFYEAAGYWELDEEVTTIEDVDVEFVRMGKTLGRGPGDG